MCPRTLVLLSSAWTKNNKLLWRNVCIIQERSGFSKGWRTGEDMFREWVEPYTEAMDKESRMKQR
jgi:hypothetical protein